MVAFLVFNWFYNNKKGWKCLNQVIYYQAKEHGARIICSVCTTNEHTLTQI